IMAILWFESPDHRINDSLVPPGRPQDMFSDTAIELQPVFAQWIQNTYALAPSATSPGATTGTSLTWGVLLLLMGGSAISYGHMHPRSNPLPSGWNCYNMGVLLARLSVSVSAQQSAFAVGVLFDLYAFHRSTGNSLCPYRTPAW
ncbi:photosystem I P700 apoprotein A1, partial [Tanacetum coccineum]